MSKEEIGLGLAIKYHGRVRDAYCLEIGTYIKSLLQQEREKIGKEIEIRLCSDYCDILDTGGSCKECLEGTISNILQEEKK